MDASRIEALVQRLRRGGRQLAQLQMLHELVEATAPEQAQSPANVRAIIAAGALPVLVQHLRGSGVQLQRAAGALLAQLIFA